MEEGQPMPRHRAPSTRHQALSSLAVTGAALGASLLSPFTAAATPNAWAPPTQPARPGTTSSGGGRCDEVIAEPSGEYDGDEVREELADAEPGEVVCVPVDADADTRHHRERAPRHRHGSEFRHATRPMTTGERQQRLGCLQGYIVDDCEQFSVENLLRRGIDPLQ
jgi:hypothetical protein